ncbi:L,D-transpeptidase [Streptomyces odonnellii]|uniref:L,D-transpeptidase n=1 Tax=Streptomyces odonnellii TaxID=1417980 RepID=UPI000695BBF2|nr:L,D-transpeptidase [Streptomyces odonnellii]
MSDDLTDPVGLTGGCAEAGVEAGAKAGAGADARSRAQLSGALRELAQSHESPPRLPGAEIRRRAAVRRGRRRGAALAGGAVAAGAVVVALTVGFGAGQDGPAERAATPAASRGAPAPLAGTADLSRRLLTVAGRELPISSGALKAPTPTGRMTVTAKYLNKRMPTEGMGAGAVVGREYEVRLPWVIELRTPDNRTNYIVAMTYNESAPGRQDTTHGWIGLRSSDAEWLYERLRPGDILAVEGAASPGGSGQ